MKKLMALTGCCMLTVAGAFACTGMYAGKDATADGSVLIGRTADFSPYNATMRQQVCKAGSQTPFKPSEDGKEVR